MRRIVRSNSFIGTLVLLFGGGVGYAVALAAAPTPISDNTRQGGYEFINPLLSCDVMDDTQYTGYADLQHKLQKAADEFIGNGDATRISVYVRNMDSGKWTGVRPGDNFIPASLMKVPLMIAYYQAARTDPSILTQAYYLDSPTDKNAAEVIRPSHPLPLGQSYTVQELIDAMIRYSDNNAEALLNAHVPSAALNDVYFNFGVSPAPDQANDNVPPIDYMRFFRILYNGTYLGRTRSQEVLQLMSQTDFTQGIIAGLPSGTIVSHKFGERSVSDENASTGATMLQKRELHDCGIVYYPKNPYGICVMTEGTDLGKLSSAIAQLSKITYQEVRSGMLEK